MMISCQWKLATQMQVEEELEVEEDVLSATTSEIVSLGSASRSDTTKRGTNAKSTTDTISKDAADVSSNFDSLTESTGVDEYSGKDFVGETPTYSNGHEGVVKAHPVSVPEPTVTRPQRRAAREARDRIVARLMDN